MKCRILKKGKRFYAQVEVKRAIKGGKFSRTATDWKNINRTIYDFRDGDYEVDYFENEKQAEKALLEYAEDCSEGIIVKEFEL